MADDLGSLMPASPPARQARARPALALARRSKRQQGRRAAPAAASSGTMFGPSRGRTVGVLVGLDEDRGDADRDRRARQHRHEFALAAAGRRPARPAAAPSGSRRTPPASRSRPGSAARACRRPACCSRSWRRARRPGRRRLPELAHLAGDVLHVPGRQELALLDVDRRPVSAAATQQVGLPAEEGRDLQHVDRLGHRRALLGARARRSAPGSQ